MHSHLPNVRKGVVNMIAYHWSPHCFRRSIEKHGLLVPSKHPILVVPVTCSQGHRNPHISLGKTPSRAWELAGGFLRRREIEQGRNPIYSLPLNRIWWDLYEVNLGVDNAKGQRGIRYRSNGFELQVAQDISKSHVRWIAERSARTK